uniref:MATH domain-containing protein n=1 Tax=Branchiostoma floridae TaxID=7739 RepID=C3ZUK6_BRAFL|eukprot:XP_002587707.1 hypothetical protein BRAFLDRAFT_94610 [Branchiostoma floridae]
MSLTVKSSLLVYMRGDMEPDQALLPQPLVDNIMREDDMMLLVQAVRNGNPDLYTNHSDEEMIHFLKPHRIKAYETASVVEAIIAEFSGAAGLDIDGIPLFKSAEAVDHHWATASKHLSCMQEFSPSKEDRSSMREDMAIHEGSTVHMNGSLASYTWTLEDATRESRSPTFEAGDHEWTLFILPTNRDSRRHLGVFLGMKSGNSAIVMARRYLGHRIAFGCEESSEGLEGPSLQSLRGDYRLLDDIDREGNILHNKKYIREVRKPVLLRPKKSDSSEIDKYLGDGRKEGADDVVEKRGEAGVR